MVDLLVEDHAYAFARITAQSRMVVVFNNAAQAVTLHIPLAGSGVLEGAMLEDCFGGTPAVEARNNAVDVRLAPHSVAIYR